MKRDIGLMSFGLVVGLLATGVFWLVSSRPRGNPVQLYPPPTAAPLLVHVSGAVAQPGVVAIARDQRVRDAIQAAGGFLPEANTQFLNLAALLQDGDRLVVPTLAPTPVSIQANTPVQGQPLLQPAPIQPSSEGLININTASLDELDRLPGIGPKFAQRIIDFRELHGPFLSIEAIIDVDGIGPTTFERIKDLITVGYSP